MTEGVQFMVNTAGKKTAVLIDLRKHADLWEDLYDCLLAERRKNEPRESLSTVKRLLKRYRHPASA
jgi:hypothetical protein